MLTIAPLVRDITAGLVFCLGMVLVAWWLPKIWPKRAQAEALAHKGQKGRGRMEQQDTRVELTEERVREIIKEEVATILEELAKTQLLLE